MKIVIKIPEETYDFVQNTSFVEDENTLFKQSNADRQKTLYLFDILDAIRNGTPLPEHHGDLISKEQAIELVEFYQLNPQHFDFVNLIDEIKDEKPIIEGRIANEDSD